ncbi:MAG: TrkA C-terminal domain-containing protein, partial [Candidatus Nanopelagicales bacterium]
FDEAWGVDVAVSTPRIVAALVEEAVSVGELVRLFSFRKGNADLVEITLATDSPVIGKRVDGVPLPTDCVLVAILRQSRVIAPSPDDSLEIGDELLFVSSLDQQDALQQIFRRG